MWAALKVFGVDKIAVKGVIILAAIIGFLSIVTIAYMAGKRDESVKQELKRKDDIISGLRDDLKLQKQLTEKAEIDRNELAIQKNEDDTALADYAAKLKKAETRKNDDAGPVQKGQVNQCRNACSIDSDFLGVLSRRRVR